MLYFIILNTNFNTLLLLQIIYLSFILFYIEEGKVYTNMSSDSIYVIYKGLFRSYVSSQRKNKCYKEWNYKFIFMKKIC